MLIVPSAETIQKCFWICKIVAYCLLKGLLIILLCKRSCGQMDISISWVNNNAKDQRCGCFYQIILYDVMYGRNRILLCHSIICTDCNFFICLTKLFDGKRVIWIGKRNKWIDNVYSLANNCLIVLVINIILWIVYNRPNKNI